MARPRSDIEPRVLHAARARFLAEGVDGASLRTIASDARTNVGMISYYFATKDDLFLAVVEEVYGRLVEDLGHALLREGGVRDKLAAAFERIGAASDDEIQVIRLIIREALLVPRSPRLSRLLTRFREGHLGMLLKAMSQGVADGEIDDTIPLPLLVITTLAMAGAPQLIRRIAGDELPFSLLPPPNELAAHMLELLFRGVAPAKTTKKPEKKRAQSKR
jgi:AcrR family transcriptional regulator